MSERTETTGASFAHSSRSTVGSVIVPAYNARRTLRSVIDACLKQEIDAARFEVVIVDDGSCDGTWEIAQALAQHAAVTAVRQPHFGVAAARNRGAEIASGEVLVFCDADIIPPPNWLARLVEAASSRQVGLVGCVYASADGLPLAASCVHEGIRQRQITGPDEPIHIGSFAMALRRSLWEQTGGFDPRFLRAQDTELSYRLASLGYRSRLLKDIAVRHQHARGLGNWLANQYRQAFWRVRTYARHPDRTSGDGYSSWHDWVSLAAASGAVVTAPLVLLGNLWAVPAALLVGLAALQIPSTAFAIGDTGQWRHLAVVPMQMMRSFAWFAGGIAGVFSSRRATSAAPEPECEVDVSSAK